MFDQITLRGTAASLVWGYRPVAVLRGWTIRRTGATWTLTATLDHADRLQCQQAVNRKELLFEAPRDRGRWCWELLTVTIGASELTAELGPPVQ